MEDLKEIIKKLEIILRELKSNDPKLNSNGLKLNVIGNKLIRLYEVEYSLFNRVNQISNVQI
jgi:hypothetical protein